MDTKPLLYGLIGFFIGGLLVAVAATTFDKPAQNSRAATSMMAGNASAHMTTESLRNKTGDEFDKAFMKEMIAHHNNAVDMAKLVADRANHTELKTLANDIIRSQSKEIIEMRNWQMQWGYEVNSSPHTGDNPGMH